MKSIILLAFTTALALTATACQERAYVLGGSQRDSVCAPASAVPTSGPAHVDVPTTGVRSITLPTIDTDLPPGPGKLTLVSACTFCHSPRYMTMQPNFSKKKWTEEVDKMKKVYGAPIQDEQVEPIVNYLVAIRGNGQ
jgi:hypothetical protein